MLRLAVPRHLEFDQGVVLPGPTRLPFRVHLGRLPGGCRTPFAPLFGVEHRLEPVLVHPDKLLRPSLLVLFLLLLALLPMVRGVVWDCEERAHLGLLFPEQLPGLFRRAPVWRI